MGRVCVLSVASALLLVMLFVAGSSAKPQIRMQQSGEDDLSYGNDSVEIPVQVVPGQGLPLPQEVIQVDDENVPAAPAPGGEWGGRGSNDGRNDPDRNEETVIEGDPDSGTLIREEVVEDVGAYQVMGQTATSSKPRRYQRPYPQPSTPEYGDYDWGSGRVYQTMDPRPGTTVYASRPGRPSYGYTAKSYMTTRAPDPEWGDEGTSTPSASYPDESEPNCRCVCKRRPIRRRPPPPSWEPVRTDNQWNRQMGPGGMPKLPGADEAQQEHEKGKKRVEEEHEKNTRRIWIIVGVVLGVLVLIVVVSVVLFLVLRNKKKRGAVLAAAADGATGGGPAAAAPGRSASGASAGKPVTVPMDVSVQGTSAGSS